MHEVDGESVDCRAELSDRIQPLLGPPPVVAVSPVGAECLQLVEVDALRRVRCRLRPASAPQPGTKVVEVIVRHFEMERRDGVAWHAFMIAQPECGFENNP